MDFTHSAKVLELKAQLEAFMDEHVYPNEAEYDAFTRDHNSLWTQPPLMVDLAQKGLNAIRGNHLYVVSHPETQPAVEARFQRILDAYDLIPS